MVKIVNKQNIAFALIFVLFLLIHRYIYLYADDLYYARDASYGLNNLTHFINSELHANGRVWLGVATLGILYFKIALFRIINPLIIALTAFLITKISLAYEKSEETVICLFCCGAFFAFLPVEISHTTIYYAACSFNYLYPTVLALLYAYLLNLSYKRNCNSKWLIAMILLAFLVGSSTQQAGMIGIGYTVLFSSYYRFSQTKISLIKSLPYLLALLAGYSIVTYGSLQRIHFEEQSANVIDLKGSLSGLLEINLFSVPVSGYVLMICLCCLIWLYHYTYKQKEKLNNAQRLSGRILGWLLSFSIIVYIYIVIYKKYPVELSIGGTIDTIAEISSMSMLIFAMIYFMSITCVCYLILREEKNPFLLFNWINAFGAQLMLIAVSARFGHYYKIMFPSLLLMAVFMTYTVIKFNQNKIFLLLIAASFGLPFYDRYPDVLISVLLILIFFCAVLSSHNFRIVITSAIVVLSLLTFGATYHGYRSASTTQEYNLNAIRQYQQDVDKRVLILKKVPPTRYGYNVGNWNDMPYFMRECYGIEEKTIIQYKKE